MQFTVIIPTRNRPEFLPLAVESVLSQSVGELELIIVNDGDDDVADFGDRRVRVLKSSRPGGVRARNQGVAAAMGTFIAFLDDDDRWCDRHFLAAALDAFNAGADFVFADGRMVYPDGRPPQVFAQDADADSLSRDNTILISAVTYRHSLHETLGMFDESIPYYWDWDWYLRVARGGSRLQHIPRVAVDIRIHENNMSGTANADARQADLTALARKHTLGDLTLKSHVDFLPG